MASEDFDILIGTSIFAEEDRSIDLVAMCDQLRQLEEERLIANSKPLDQADLNAVRGQADLASTVIITDEAAYRLLGEIADSRAYQTALGPGTAIELLAELQVARDLIEALQWMPEHTINFCDAEDYIHEIRQRGWKPSRELAPKPVQALAQGPVDCEALTAAVASADREFGESNGL